MCLLRRSHIRPARRRGVALIGAIIVVGLAGIVLATMARQLRIESRRTNQTMEDAQLRQLVHAAAVLSLDRAPGRVQVTLPEELRTLGYSLSFDIEDEDDGRQVKVLAQHLEHTMRQTLFYQRVENKWRFMRSE